MDSLKFATYVASIALLLVIVLSFITREFNVALLGMVGTAWGALIAALANQKKPPKEDEK